MAQIHKIALSATHTHTQTHTYRRTHTDAHTGTGTHTHSLTLFSLSRSQSSLSLSPKQRPYKHFFSLTVSLLLCCTVMFYQYNVHEFYIALVSGEAYTDCITYTTTTCCQRHRSSSQRSFPLLPLQALRVTSTVGTRPENKQFTYTHTNLQSLSPRAKYYTTDSFLSSSYKLFSRTDILTVECHSRNE